MTDIKDPLEQSEDLVQSDDETNVKTTKADKVKALLARGSANDKLKGALKKLQEIKAKNGIKQDEKPVKASKKVIKKEKKPALLMKAEKPAKQAKLGKKSLTLVPKNAILKHKSDDGPAPRQKAVRRREKIVYGFCDVCFQVETNTTKPDNALITCQGKCGLKAHQRCLGFANKETSFKCNGCESKNEAKCIVCGHNGNKSLFVQEDGWAAHYLCALFCDQIEISDFATLKFQLSSDVSLVDGMLPQQGEQDDACELCKAQTGVLVRCLKRHCKKRVHMFCLQQQRKASLFKIASELYSQPQLDTDMESEPEDDAPKGWGIDLKVQDFLQVKYTSQKYAHLQEPMIQNFEFFNVERRGDNNRGFREYGEQLQLAQAVFTPSRADPEDVRQTVDLQLSKTVQKKVPPRVNLPFRGGKVSITCDEHRKISTCFCNQTKTQALSLIMCDTCMIWYHNKCEGLTGLQAKDFEQYKCQRCKEWENKVAKLIVPLLCHEDVPEDISVGPNPDAKQFDSWEGWRQSVLPNARFRRLAFNLSDILILAAAWSEQVTELTASKTVINAELLKQQIIQAHFLPLNLSRQIHILNGFANKLADYQAKNKQNYEYQIQVVMHDGKIDSKALEQNQAISSKLSQTIVTEREKFHLYSLKAMQLKDCIDSIDVIAQCAKIFTGKDQMDINHLAVLKKSIRLTDQTELNEKVKRLYWKARKWAGKAEECLEKPKHQIQGDIVKANDSKRSVQDANDLIACVSHFKAGKEPAPEDDLRTEVCFPEQIALLKEHIASTEAWDAKFAKYKAVGDNLNDFLDLLESQKALQLKSASTNEIINLVQTNKSWYDLSIRFIQPQFRQRGKPIPKPSKDELLQALKSISAMKTNKLAQQMAAKLQEIQSHFESLCTQAKTFLQGSTILNSLDEMQALLAKFKEVQVSSEDEDQLQQLASAISWSPESPTLITYETLKRVQSKIALNPELKAKYDTKMTELDEIFDQVNQKKKELLQTVSPLTLGALKNALQQLDSLQKIKETLMSKYRVDSSELKFGNSNHFAAPDHAFLKTHGWLNRILFHVRKLLDIRTNKQKASKDKDGLELLPQVMKIKKDMLKSLIVDADTHNNGILQLSKVAMDILNAIRDKKGANDVQTVADEKRVSQAQLEVLADKAKKMQDIQSYESLTKQIELSKLWYVDYEKVKQNDFELQKNLVKSTDSAKQLLKQADELIVRKADLKLETKQGYTKMIQKIQKYSSMIIDARILLASKDQTEVPFERFRDIVEQLRYLQQAQYHCLKSYCDILEFRSMLAEGLRYSIFEQDIAQLIKSKPYETQSIKARIDQVRTEMKVNVTQGVQLYLGQIEQSDIWSRTASESNHAAEQADLLKQYELKKYDSLLYVNPSKVTDLKVKYIKHLFAQKSSTQTPNDFVVKVREVLNESMTGNTDIAEELLIFDLARKIRSLMWENKAAKCADKLANWKMISVADATQLVRLRSELPFAIPDFFIDKFSEQIKLHDKLREATNKALKKDCTIDTIKPLFEDVKALILSSELAKELTQMSADFQFVENLWHQIQNPPETADEALFEASILRKACKVELKLNCESIEKIRQFYESQWQMFQETKKAIEKQKQQSFSLEDVEHFNCKLKELRVDFEQEEADIRRNLWHTKVTLVFADIDAKDCKDKTVQSDILRYWLEEGTELDLDKDPKYERLNDYVEDIDEVIKVMRNCANDGQIEEVLKLAEEAISARLNFDRLVERQKQRIADDEVPKSKYNMSSPAGYLQLYLNKKKASWDEDVEMDNQAESESDTDDSELLASDEEDGKKDSKVKQTGLAASLKSKILKPGKNAKEPKTSKGPKDKSMKKREKKAADKKEKSVELTAAQIERQKKLEAMKEKLKKKSPSDIKPEPPVGAKIAAKKEEPAVKEQPPKQAPAKKEAPVKTVPPKKEAPAKADKPAPVKKEKAAAPKKEKSNSKPKVDSEEPAEDEPKVAVKKEAKIKASKKQASPEKDTQPNSPKKQEEKDGECSVDDSKATKTSSKPPSTEPKAPIVTKKPLIGVKRPAAPLGGGMKGLNGGISEDLKKKLFS